VYGVSFLIVAVNLALWFTLRYWSARFRAHGRRAGLGGRGVSLPLGLAALLFMPVLSAIRSGAPSGPTGSLRVLGVQGDIPMCRAWTQDQFLEALDTYVGLTLRLASTADPDLVVWPECAVPAAIGYPPFRAAFEDLLERLDCAILIGALDTRLAPGARRVGNRWQPPPMDFNSAMLFDADGSLRDRYDKIHLVPFGEFTPFSNYLPWLVKWIGMGRDLTPGTEYTIFPLPKGARAGVNICFEDAFASISRTFARRGANLLMTITNDAWYAESAGARQHLIHAVFRAVECGLPLFRSGNNSGTCLILPDGTVTDVLRDPETGSPFVRGARVYDIPFPLRPTPTFYVRRGDLFAGLCVVIAAGIVAAMGAAAISRCRRGFRVVRPDEDGEHP
jgi:apolipoprotein N-acyltransferase